MTGDRGFLTMLHTTDLNKMKDHVLRAVTCCLLAAFVLCTGCDRFKARMDRNRAQRQEEEKYKFDTDKDFLNFYRKEITNALRNKDKDGLIELFCETVAENTCDLDEGAEYLFGMEEWDEIGILRSDSSSYKEYNPGEHFTFVNAWEDISVDDTNYRIYFSGFASYYTKEKSRSSFSKENTGLTNLLICELDDDNNPVTAPYDAICGIYHPGREACERIFDTVLNTYSSTNDDGSYIETMTDEALESIMTPGLLKQADKDELEAFIRFIRYGSQSKKNQVFALLDGKNGNLVLTNIVHFELEDRCLTIRFKDGLIDGAAFSENADKVMPGSGEIRGFFGVVD